MKLNVLDKAIEHLIEQDIKSSEIIDNNKTGQPIPVMIALQVWASQLRYNIALQGNNSIDSLEYQPWSGYKLICGENLYTILEQEALQYPKVLPEYYNTSTLQQISKYVYKKILGVEPIPVSVSTEDLWSKIKQVYGIREELREPDIDRLIRAVIKINKMIRLF